MQMHKRLKLEQVKLILDWYQQGLVTQLEACNKLGIKRRRFFTLLHDYRTDNLKTLDSQRSNSHRRITPAVEAAIRTELSKDKDLINNPDIPVKTYNYRAIRDAVVAATGQSLSAQTVRNRARDWGFYLERPVPRVKHTRVVLTIATGLLLQHDASHHQWSPLAIAADGKPLKWCLITTIDDYSRMLLFAGLFEEETAWSHILALKQVVLTYGTGSNYYTDNHSIFRYASRLESRWQTPRVSTKDIKTQWQRAVTECSMDTIHALSPEAKGKIERPYRWLQDRIVRRSARQNAKTIDEVRQILASEVDRYNNRQVHSTTKEIPIIRFQRAQREGNTVFRKFTLPSPYTSLKDVFCLKETRVVNGYSQISWRNRYFKVPRTIPEGATVNIHIVPDDKRPELRIWYRNSLVTAVLLAPTNQPREKQA